MNHILSYCVEDIRFPTSSEFIGSDSVHTDPDYSAVYLRIKTDTNYEGHGLTFTIGRGNEICKKAVESLMVLVIGKDMENITKNFGKFWRSLTQDSQLRWIGPEKGVIHLATACIVNTLWDLYSKIEGKPLWKLLVDMTPRQIVDCIDFSYITDALTPEEALDILERNRQGIEQRENLMLKNGYPAYTTSTGWLGYSDEKIRKLCREAIQEGWTHFKIKVGRDINDDIRRCKVIREEIGWDNKLMMDANQIWSVDEAIKNMNILKQFDPWWIEEPTSPDDILGHGRIAKEIEPVSVATGEMCQNRIIFKQLIQVKGLSFLQIDSCRLGGVNEILSVLLMAAKYNIPVCPHAGGVGLCEYVQHLSIFDYICVSVSLENRVVEYVDHLHEHFIDPVIIKDCCYVAPKSPGYSIAIKKESIETYKYPNGLYWKNVLKI